MAKFSIIIDYDSNKLCDKTYFEYLLKYATKQVELELYRLYYIRHNSEVLPKLDTFEDIVHEPPEVIQMVLRNIDKTKLVYALKGASETARNIIFDNVSERAVVILKEDMAETGPVRVKDVDDAQKEIVKIVNDFYAGKPTPAELQSQQGD